MNTERKPVDVLAVMDAAIAVMPRDYPNGQRKTFNLREARAAVAELIEVERAEAAEMAEAMALADRSPKLHREILVGRVALKHADAKRAALARIGGDA